MVRLLAAALASVVLASCQPAGPTAAPSPSPVGSTTPATPAATRAATGEPTTGGPTTGGPTAGAVDTTGVGRAFVETLARGDFAAAEQMCNDTMRAAAPAAKLQQAWQGFTAQYGAYRGIGDVQSTAQPPFTIVLVRTAFADATMTLTVTVTVDGAVGGFHVRAVEQASPAPSASPAAYVSAESFTESDVTVGSAPWTLPGTLTMPKGAGPYPAVVLVAGSGPEDRDETIGPNKPLRDVAWGLASRGIAVLRYDKRTLVHGSQFVQPPLSTTYTVKEETVDDAVAAVALLRSRPGIDPTRVFVAGHSLGGYVAPRIAGAVTGRLRGIAMLEANSRPLSRLILDQVRYLASLSSTPDPSGQAQISALEAAVARAESPDLSPSTPASELPLGLPASYWLDLRAYDAVAVAGALPIPMLFTQGGRDYQVTRVDLQGWRQGLASRSDVTFREYPALDHLLLAGTGPPSPAEYSVPGHVDAAVVDDLSGWILGQ